MFKFYIYLTIKEAGKGNLLPTKTSDDSVTNFYAFYYCDISLIANA